MTGQSKIPRRAQWPRVKICGITSVEAARYVLAAGGDAIGLVFYADSPRYVSIEKANLIARSVGPLVTVVGLFVNAQPRQVEETIAQVPLNLLQFKVKSVDLERCSG